MSSSVSMDSIVPSSVIVVVIVVVVIVAASPFKIVVIVKVFRHRNIDKTIDIVQFVRAKLGCDSTVAGCVRGEQHKRRHHCLRWYHPVILVLFVRLLLYLVSNFN